ncbi:MAG: hypothetical protein H7067_14855 [Burkholderiales bacterium]|nr:hypothetical protein [Opitutaceae bacterium]
MVHEHLALGLFLKAALGAEDAQPHRAAAVVADAAELVEARAPTIAGAEESGLVAELVVPIVGAFLEDPNTGVKLYESADIIDYLERQYAAK